MPAPAHSSPLPGYVAAAGLVALVFFNLGLLALLLSPFAVLLHHWAARGAEPVAASHQRFLLRTWLYIALIHIALYASLGWALFAVFDLIGVATQAMAAADPGEEFWLALQSVFAYLSAGDGSRFWALIGLMLAHALASLLLTLWLSVRLIRRWLRWTDGLPA